MGGVPWIYEAPSRPATQEASSGFKVEADDARAVRFRAKLSVFLKFQSAVNPQFYHQNFGCEALRVVRIFNHLMAH